MLPLHMLALLIVLILSTVSAIKASESIRAELIGEATVLTTLSFTNEIEYSRQTGFIDYGNFPPVIYSLARTHQEGTISFTKGVWDDFLWSAPSFHTKAAGFELELIGNNGEANFKKTLNAISGYFCSSTSRLKTETVWAEGDTIFATLPQESLCTENLKPFVDLLPCKDVSGLASMLRPEVLHQSEYYSMQVHFKTIQNRITFQASLFLVNDLKRWNRQGKYSLPSVLGKLPNGTCGQANVNLFGESVALEGIEKVSVTLPSEIPSKRAVRAMLFKSGVGDLEAGFGVRIENDSLTEANVSVLLTIPWMFLPIWHEATNFKSVKSFKLTPAKFDRKSSTFAELQINLPAQSSIIFHVPFRREFLRLDEFPANSERGIDFPPARISLETDQFSTNSLLFTWPIPDGTMPFNVITMSSTVIALFYGAIFNMLFRRFYLRRPEDPPASPLLKLIWKLKQLVRKQNQ